jgi:phage tail sheath protein FI
VSVTPGLPVYVGAAPINSGDLTNVNVPVRVDSLADAVTELGIQSTDFDPSTGFTLCEAISQHFAVENVGPIVLINVLDPTDANHIAEAYGEAQTLDADGEATLDEFGAIVSSVVVSIGGTTYTLTTDYTLAFDTDGFLVVSRVTSGAIPAGATISVTYDYLDPSGVTVADIIGGYSAVTGAYTGLEVVQQVFPTLRLVPGFICVPGWSHEPTVAARMTVIAELVSGAFKAVALTDLDASPYEIATFADAPAWKTNNGYTSEYQINFWPLFQHGTAVYHLSTVCAAVANQNDYDHDSIPYASPSNEDITGDAAVLDDGTNVRLYQSQANAINAQGIVTALNTFNGWVLWGNRTGAYPGNTDPKDAFIPIRRMFNWIENTIILTVQRDVDEPGNRRLIDGVVGTVQSFLNGLIAIGALIDGLIEFRSDENTTTDMADGIYNFHLTLTPPSPAEEINFIVEYDPTALAALFA